MNISCIDIQSHLEGAERYPGQQDSIITIIIILIHQKKRTNPAKSSVQPANKKISFRKRLAESSLALSKKEELRLMDNSNRKMDTSYYIRLIPLNM